MVRSYEMTLEITFGESGWREETCWSISARFILFLVGYYILLLYSGYLKLLATMSKLPALRSPSSAWRSSRPKSGGTLVVWCLASRLRKQCPRVGSPPNFRYGDFTMGSGIVVRLG